MLLIKTEYGTFGSYKDLYLYMQEERLKEVRVINEQYVFQSIPFSSGLLTIDEVKNIIS